MLGFQGVRDGGWYFLPAVPIYSYRHTYKSCPPRRSNPSVQVGPDARSAPTCFTSRASSLTPPILACQ